MKIFWKVFWIGLFGFSTIHWGINFFNLCKGIIPNKSTIGTAILFTGFVMLVCTIKEITKKID